MKLLTSSIFSIFIIAISSGSLLSQIEYTVIENQKIFFRSSQKKTGIDEVVISRGLNTGEERITPLNLDPYGKVFFTWTKKQKEIVVSWVSLGNSITKRTKAVIQTFQLETKDAIERKRFNEILIDSMVNVYGDELRALVKINDERELKENLRRFNPVADWFRVFDLIIYNCKNYYPVQFDFIPESDSTYLFYIRNRKELSVWHFTYPQEKSIKSKRSDWKEIVTYCIDTIPFIAGSPYISMRQDSTKHLPFGKHHLYQSIQDTSFFKGNFKIIQQGKNTFCINLHLGDIYHIGKEAIVRVGEVNVKDYPRWVLSRPLFIEDRDNNELIFLADVKRTNEAAPFPNIKVQKNRLELLREFPGLKVN